MPTAKPKVKVIQCIPYEILVNMLKILFLTPLAAILIFSKIQNNGHHYRMTIYEHTKYENDPTYGL